MKKTRILTQFPVALIFFAFLLANLAGCGVLMGNIKPEDQKSSSYGVLDLSRENSDWIRLDPKEVGGIAPGTDPDTLATEVSDVAFQSKGTASIISLNSACRADHPTDYRDLKALTNILLMGASHLSLREEQALTVQGTPALETTIEGIINDEKVKLRSVVLKRQACVYDLVYIARPSSFDVQLQDFLRFVASLRLK